MTIIVAVANVPSHAPITSTKYQTWLESKHHVLCTYA